MNILRGLSVIGMSIRNEDKNKGIYSDVRQCCLLLLGMFGGLLHPELSKTIKGLQPSGISRPV